MDAYPRSLFAMRRHLRSRLAGYAPIISRMAEDVALETAAHSDPMHGYYAGLRFAARTLRDPPWDHLPTRPAA